MRLESDQITITWREFDVGEYVRRTSHRSTLLGDRVYQVSDYETGIAPESRVMVKGESCWHATEFITACDANGWREDASGPYDSDYPPGASEWPEVSREEYEANGFQWPKSAEMNP